MLSNLMQQLRLWHALMQLCEVLALGSQCKAEGFSNTCHPHLVSHPGHSRTETTHTGNVSPSFPACYALDRHCKC